MSRRIHRRWLLCIVASFACSPTPPTQSVAQTDLIAYRELLDDVIAATTHYRAVMMDDGMTAGLCAQFHDAYDVQVRGYLDQMPEFAGEMDAVMTDHEAAAAADAECVTAAMRDELDRHASAACSWSDLAIDRMEANRYVNAMTVLTTHATERCTEMQRGLDGRGWSWGEMMASCQAE